MEWVAKFYINQDVKSREVREEFKHLAKQRKKEFIAEVWDRLRIRVYKVLPGKKGNTNTGNNARDFFKGHEVVAEICDVEHFLIGNVQPSVPVILMGYQCLYILQFETGGVSVMCIKPVY